MRLGALTLLVLITYSTAVVAHDQSFPYQAVVNVDNVNVRSGPGRQFYPAARLRRGSRVVVHRHDPGGWYMIAPPPGSFSWIRAEYVELTGGNQGRLITDGVVVWVGSSLEDSHNVKQETLSTNDRVELLGEEIWNSDGRSVRMYKIAPPPHEYRWMLGKFISREGRMVRRQNRNDPFAHRAQPQQLRAPGQSPIDAERSPGDAWPTKTSTNQQSIPQRKSDGFVERKVVRIHDAQAVNRRGPDAAALDAERAELKQLDQRFRTMIDKEPRKWEFGDLRVDYQDLQKRASVPALASQVDLRFEAIDRYAKIRSEYDDFVQLTSATTQTEQQLSSIQQQHAATFDVQSIPVNIQGQPYAVPSQQMTPTPMMQAAPPVMQVPTPPMQHPAMQRPAMQAAPQLMRVAPQMMPAPAQVPFTQAPGPIMRTPIPASRTPVPMLQSPVPTSQTPVPTNQPPIAIMQQQTHPMRVPAPRLQAPVPVVRAPAPSLQAPIPMIQSPAPAVRTPTVIMQSPAHPAYTPAPTMQPPVRSPRLPALESPQVSPPMLQAPIPATPSATFGTKVSQHPSSTIQPSAYRVLAQQQSRLRPTQPKRIEARRTPQLDGAGIVQQTVAAEPGMPKHVLLAPTGRILAYLQPAKGVDFKQHLGMPMGINGRRFRDQNLQSDVIVVEHLTPVRLAPQQQ